MKRKDDKYYDEKIKEIKREKRSLGTISPSEYGEKNDDGIRMTNKKIKEIKDDLKRVRRGLKRSQKHQVDRHIEDELLKWDERKNIR